MPSAVRRTRRSLAVASVIAVALAGFPFVSPAVAVEYGRSVNSFDQKRDVGILEKSKANKNIDILSGTTYNYIPIAGAGTLASSMTMTMLMRHVTPWERKAKGKVRQNYAVAVRTSYGKYLYSYSTYGERKGYRKEFYKDGHYQPMSDDCLGVAASFSDADEGKVSISFGKDCIVGNTIKQVGFYVWQTSEFDRKHPRQADNWAQDSLIDDVNLPINRPGS